MAIEFEGECETGSLVRFSLVRVSVPEFCEGASLRDHYLGS